jgi:hypothetical protein
MFFFNNRDKIQVHVVVDPILSKILRPHQREVKFSNFFHLKKNVFDFRVSNFFMIVLQVLKLKIIMVVSWPMKW